MEIEEREAGQVVVLALRGRLTLGEGDEQLRDAINRLLDRGRRHIVLNLGDVSYIDSTGLGEIVRSYTTLKQRGGTVKLLNLTTRAVDLLSITRLLPLFETFDSEPDAIGSFTATEA